MTVVPRPASEVSSRLPPCSWAMPADGQPQPQTVGRRVQPVGVEIAVEDRLLQLRGDAHAGVGHGQLHLLPAHPDLHCHPLLPRPDELKGVGQQIQQQPPAPRPRR